jgi:hypothetical protein
MKIVSVIYSKNLLPRSVNIIPHIVTFEDETGKMEVSDGYHTFSELYEHRYALFCALVKAYDSYKTPLGSAVTCWKSKLHSDGTMFDDSFIVQMIVRKLDGTKEQISYHLPLSWWNKFTCMRIDKAWEWDGHTSKDVIERLLGL